MGFQQEGQGGQRARRSQREFPCAGGSGHPSLHEARVGLLASRAGRKHITCHLEKGRDICHQCGQEGQ